MISENRIKNIIIFLLIFSNGMAILLFTRKFKNYNLIYEKYLEYKDVVDMLEYVSELEGRKFPVELLEKIEKNNLYSRESFEKSHVSIITLFSTLSCTVCLDDELRHIENLFKFVNKNNFPIKVFGIAHASKKQEIYRFKRSSKITFPIFFDVENELAEYFKLTHFPVTLLLDTRNHLIIEANHPVKENLAWSKLFYNFSKNYIKNIYLKPMK